MSLKSPQRCTSTLSCMSRRGSSRASVTMFVSEFLSYTIIHRFPINGRLGFASARAVWAADRWIAYQSLETSSPLFSGAVLALLAPLIKISQPVQQQVAIFLHGCITALYVCFYAWRTRALRKLNCLKNIYFIIHMSLAVFIFCCVSINLGPWGLLLGWFPQALVLSNRSWKHRDFSVI